MLYRVITIKCYRAVEPVKEDYIIASSQRDLEFWFHTYIYLI